METDNVTPPKRIFSEMENPEPHSTRTTTSPGAENLSDDPVPPTGNANLCKRTFSKVENPEPDATRTTSPVVENPQEGHAQLQEEEPSPAVDFTPRNYQVKVFEVAMKRNTIAVLETGTGKTMIALMLIREIRNAAETSDPRRVVIFLAPTEKLVIQQCQVAKDYLGLEVGEYYGSKGVDNKTLDGWEKEIAEHDVLVMTPQILLDALRKAFLNLSMFSLLIFDECHRATGNHPYVKIMKEFYHKLHDKPKVFGMTASPVLRKGVSSAMDCDYQMSELESMLDSQIYTIEDKSEMQAYVSTASYTCRLYDKAQFNLSELHARIGAARIKFDASISAFGASAPGSYQDLDDKLSKLKKELSTDQAKIMSCLEDLGLLCALEAAKICLENAQESETCREILLHHRSFLKEILQAIEESLPSVDSIYAELEGCLKKSVVLGYVSPKLYELLQLMLSIGNSPQIWYLIFVERKITAHVLETFVKKLAFLEHLSAGYLTGTSSSANALTRKTQMGVLESFRCGKVNLLFATEVLEEGLDIPNCSCVVRFDLPKSVRSYVQSRGRARHSVSHYVVMLERGNEKQGDQLFDIIRSEWSMMDVAVGRHPDMWTSKAYNPEETEVYRVGLTGASITADSSISRLYQYCEKLPRDKYYTPKPSFDYECLDYSYRCTVQLPPNAAVQMVVGPSSRSRSLAKQLVCLEACKNLHQVGALDDHLLPAIKGAVEDDYIVKSTGVSAGAGTTKRKELHGTAQIRALYGSWIEKLDGVGFHAYQFNFDCNVATDVYSDFVLLIESKLDDDVGNFDMNLYLLRKMVKASVSYCGKVHLDAEQMMKAKHFHELFFNGLFGGLYTGNKRPRDFLLRTETWSLWSTSNLYLLLPLETPGSDGSWKIDWTIADATSSVVQFLRNKEPHPKHNAAEFPLVYIKRQKHNAAEEGCPLPRTVESSVSQSIDTDRLQFANIPVDVSSIPGMAVLAVHTGKVYVVHEVKSSMSAESPFEATSDAKPSRSFYNTYKEYYNKKYGIVLKNAGQPLLLLKQSHNPHNLLVNFDDEGRAKNGKMDKERQYAHMPPELLIFMDIPGSVVKSLYLFPSLVQRLQSLMLASQLRQEIDCCAPNFHISSSLMLEAITTLRCSESFSMERLELLGDSILKYAVSCYLFLKHTKYHEGQLSALRTQAVRNETLYKMGTERKLQVYIRDYPFEPLMWVAPGQKSKCQGSRMCKCGLDTLEVPLDAKFHSEDPKIKLGQSCEMGHRWMGSKTIADCVEAVIGAYYVSGGMVAALHAMKWFGIDTQIEPSLVDEAIASASLWSYMPKEDEVKSLELKLGYSFAVKFLLEEALTHASMQERGVGYCYQRLEFLGDSVLDVLITWHLYQSYKDVDPGELTDLRTASVNNENFAQVAVRRNLYGHLHHCSTLLQDQITEYVKAFSESSEETHLAQGPKGPKALGDLVESIVGAILIDTRLSLDTVWRILEPLLSPIVTPQQLQLPPMRALCQLCDSLGYFIKEKYFTDKNKMELTVQLNDVLLRGEGFDTSKKNAKAKAASQLLKQLDKRGMTYTRNGSKRKQDHDSSNPISLDLANENDNKRIKTEKLLPDEQDRSNPVVGSMQGGPSGPVTGSTYSPPVIESINMKKGGPRITLFELCKKVQWPMPTFTTVEQTSRTPIKFDDGFEKRTGFSSFTSTVTLNVTGYGVLECKGDPRADKKGSLDSAALCLLHELRFREQLTINQLM